MGAKRGDHEFLFQQVEAAVRCGKATTYRRTLDGVPHRFRVVSQVALNESNQDIVVNVLEYWEVLADGTTQYFAWVTDLSLTRTTVFPIMRGGRARWKIENETFNTLKNQGYHFEHNSGHGEENLSVVFALLMMLAFLVDQLLQLACALFQAVWHKEGSKTQMWEHIRAVVYSLEFASMVDVLKALFYGYQVQGVLIFDDSS